MLEEYFGRHTGLANNNAKGEKDMYVAKVSCCRMLAKGKGKGVTVVDDATFQRNFHQPAVQQERPDTAVVQIHGPKLLLCLGRKYGSVNPETHIQLFGDLSASLTLCVKAKGAAVVVRCTARASVVAMLFPCLLYTPKGTAEIHLLSVSLSSKALFRAVQWCTIAIETRATINTER